MLVWQGDAVIEGLTGGVLPDGLAALGHPANEDLLAGTRFGRPLRGVCVLSWLGEVPGPSVGRDQSWPFGYLLCDCCWTIAATHSATLWRTVCAWSR